MRFRTTLLAAALLAGIASPALAQSPDAGQPPAERVAAAKTLFDQAQQLMDQKKYAQACSKFQASNDQVARVGTLLNLGDCYEKNGQNASAWGAYVDAITLGRRQGHPEYEDYAKRKVASLEPGLLRVTVNVPPEVRVPGMTIKRDGKVLLAEGAWGAPLPMDPGQHTFEVTAPTKKTETLHVTVLPGKNAEVTVAKLEDAPVQGPKVVTHVVQQVVEVQGFWTTQRIIGTVVAGVGALTMAGGGIFGGVAASTWNDAKTKCGPSFPTCPFDSNAPQLGDQANAYATTSTVLLIAGGAAVAAGAAVFLTGAPPHTEEGQTPDQAAVYVAPTLGGVMAFGVF